jgi:hypothetical protein
VIDCDGIEWKDPRVLVERFWKIRDEDLAAMPEISRHDAPQISPQEYECGCVAVTRITDRDALRGERPFEMRLAIPCGKAICEVTIAARKCGDPRCGISTGIHEGLTFGGGDLDENGFWSRPCPRCARAWEAAHPEDAPCWPFADQIEDPR